MDGRKRARLDMGQVVSWASCCSGRPRQAVGAGGKCLQADSQAGGLPLSCCQPPTDLRLALPLPLLAPPPHLEAEVGSTRSLCKEAAPWGKVGRTGRAKSLTHTWPPTREHLGPVRVAVWAQETLFAQRSSSLGVGQVCVSAKVSTKHVCMFECVDIHGYVSTRTCV